MLVHAHMLTPVHIQFLPTVLSTLTHTHTHTHGRAQLRGRFGVRGSAALGEARFWRRHPLYLSAAHTCLCYRGKGEVTCRELDHMRGATGGPETRFCRDCGSAGQMGVFSAFSPCVRISDVVALYRLYSGLEKGSFYLLFEYRVRLPCLSEVILCSTNSRLISRYSFCASEYI